jgi:putative hydrolase of HD superfamily
MQEIIRFILEVDKLKNVSRKVRPVGLDRYENSAEHSWQLGLFATSLAPYAEPNTDLNHVIRMLLIHDIGEIDTGDTFVFVQGGWEQRKAAELIAVKRIFGATSSKSGYSFARIVGGV